MRNIGFQTRSASYILLLNIKIVFLSDDMTKSNTDSIKAILVLPKCVGYYHKLYIVFRVRICSICDIKIPTTVGCFKCINYTFMVMLPSKWFYE